MLEEGNKTGGPLAERTAVYVPNLIAPLSAVGVPIWNCKDPQMRKTGKANVHEVQLSWLRTIRQITGQSNTTFPSLSAYKHAHACTYTHTARTHMHIHTYIHTVHAYMHSYSTPLKYQYMHTLSIYNYVIHRCKRMNIYPRSPDSELRSRTHSRDGQKWNTEACHMLQALVLTFSV